MLCVGVFGAFAARAAASVRPGWECIPVTAGKSVVSGGVGSTPSCAHGTTAVLAPTYVSHGVGGKPTVQFAAVNVQIVSGSGSTAGAKNGRGNLVLGYAENPGKLARSGSNDLIVGAGNGWTGFGDIVAGNENRVSGPYAAAFGEGNIASGSGSAVVGGTGNQAIGPYAAVSAGYANAAVGLGSSVTGGHDNTASGAESAVSGGGNNVASGPVSSVAGGYHNAATVDEASVLGGCHNIAGSGTATDATVCTQYGNSFTSVVGGIANQAIPLGSAILGGEVNGTSSGEGSTIAGGHGVYLSTASYDVSVIGSQIFNP
jgi:hypothetical protein